MGQEERMRPDVLKEYRDERIVVTWEPAYCIHAAKCLDALPEVFDVMRKPWVLVTAAEADSIADAIMQCPSGALHFRRLDGGEQEPVPAETTVEPQRNGPSYLRGRLKIVSAQGDVIREDTRAALCRCGGSAGAPFCDGTHRKIRFRAP
jgi:uncharacterized Fe-S cluster protein YjdI